MHYIKIAHNLYVSYKFVGNLKFRLPNNPLQSLSAYLTITLYFCFLFVHIKLLNAKVGKHCLYLLIIYPVTDWLLCLISLCVLRPLIQKKNFLIKGTDLTEDDFSQILYLPVEYESDDEAEDK